MSTPDDIHTVEDYIEHRKHIAASQDLLRHLRTDHGLSDAFSFRTPHGLKPLWRLDAHDLDYTHWEEHGGSGMDDGVALSHEESIARRASHREA